MELTEGILKSVDSSFHQTYNHPCEFYVCKYRGKIMYQRPYKPEIFMTEAAAKSFVTMFVRLIFWQGEYWQSCKDNIKTRTGYEVDYSGTAKILSAYGLVSRFDEAKNKKMFKDIGIELVKQGIITIEKITL